jgi:hypothetical protein
VEHVLRGLLVVALALGLLSGCGTKSFSNAVAVIVATEQDVSVFDPQMGESAEWASQWLEPAAPGQPYTREVSALDTKMIGDNSPPAALRLGIYLPDRTETGYFSLIDYDAQAGVTDRDLPFVAWFSETPVPAQAPLPVTVELQPGPNGWLVNVTVKEST